MKTNDPVELLVQNLEDARKSKDQAYKERDLLLVALSKLLPAALARHPDNEEWEDDWRNIVVIMGICEDFSLIQMTWHIHDSELPNFAHLKPYENFKWDGHTTDEKYARLARLKANTGGVFSK